MNNLKNAHEELFRRSPDECYETLDSLIGTCSNERAMSSELWHSPDELQPGIVDGSLKLSMGSDGAFALNGWSFSQLCGLCGVSRDTTNRQIARHRPLRQIARHRQIVRHAKS